MLHACITQAVKVVADPNPILILMQVRLQALGEVGCWIRINPAFKTQFEGQVINFGESITQFISHSISRSISRRSSTSASQSRSAVLSTPLPPFT